MEHAIETSPFRKYDGVVDPDDLIGREDLQRDLVERITASRPTALLGPRRFGKTSVINRVVHIQLTEPTVVLVDLFGAQTYGDLAIQFEKALVRVPAAPAARRVIDELGVRLSIALGAIKGEVTKPPAKRRVDPKQVFEELVELIVDASRSTPVVLIIDEFQSIDSVDEADAILRKYLQRNFRNLPLLLAGSEPTVMRRLLTTKKAPFYNHIETVTIGPFTQTESNTLVTAGFIDTGRDPGDVPYQIWNLLRGHPHRTAWLADHVWAHTPPGGDATQAWGAAMIHARKQSQQQFRNDFGEFGKDKRAVVRLLAHDQPVFGSAAEVLKLSAGGARTALASLEEYGWITAGDSNATIIDPMFADWLRQEFPV